MDTISIISLTIGVASFASSIVFYVQARNSEQSDRKILDDIHKAISEWQSRIMESAIEMLESRTEIIAKRSHSESAKIRNDFLLSLIENVNYIVAHFSSSENTEAQLTQLKLVLDACKEITKSNVPSIPPDVIADIYRRELRTIMPNQTDAQNGEAKDDPDQSPKD